MFTRTVFLVKVKSLYTDCWCLQFSIIIGTDSFDVAMNLFVVFSPSGGVRVL